jgi:cytochrome c biogenesis factor
VASIIHRGSIPFGARAVARTAGHLGILLVVAAALAGTGSTESTVRVQPGDSAEVDGRSVQLVSVDLLPGDDPLVAVATVIVDDEATLQPSVAVYPERGLRLPEVATRSRPWLDTQIVLRDVDAEDGALLTVLFRPWNQLVWWGVGLLTMAGLAALLSGGPVSPATADPSTSARVRGDQGREAASAVQPDRP